MKMLSTFLALTSLTAATSAMAGEDYEISRSLELTAPPEEIWNMIGDFCDIDDWHPAVTSCMLKVIDGSQHRVLTLGNGAEIVEKRVAQEPGLSYTYRIVSSPLPLENYVATLSIETLQTTTITWSGRFSSDDPGMEKAIVDIYEDGLAAIDAKLAN